MISRPRGCAYLLAACFALFPSVSFGQPAEQQNRVVAQALFEEGQKLMTAGDYAAACKKLAESQRVDPATGTKFYLAECLSHIGQLATAWNYYVEVAEESAKDQDERPRRLREGPRRGPPIRLPKLSVVVSPEARAVAGLNVVRDGVAMGEAQFRVPIPVDLGAHTVHVTAPHMKPWEGSIDVKKEGESVELAVPALEPEPVKTEPPPPPPPPQRSGTMRTVGYAVGGVGIVGIGIGAALGAVAISKRTRATTEPVTPRRTNATPRAWAFAAPRSTWPRARPSASSSEVSPWRVEP